MRVKLLFTVLLLPILQITAITPDELNTNLEFITNNIVRRQLSAKDDIDSYFAIFEDYDTQAYGKVYSDVQSLSDKYLLAINNLFVGFTKDDTEVFACKNGYQAKIEALQDFTITKIQSDIDTVIRDELVQLSGALDVLKNTALQLTDISGKIANCSTDICATDLDQELTDLYTTVLNILNFRDLFYEIDHVSNYAPTFLLTYEADISRFEASLQEYVNLVEACINDVEENSL